MCVESEYATFASTRGVLPSQSNPAEDPRVESEYATFANKFQEPQFKTDPDRETMIAIFKYSGGPPLSEQSC